MSHFSSSLKLLRKLCAHGLKSANSLCAKRKRNIVPMRPSWLSSQRGGIGFAVKPSLKLRVLQRRIRKTQQKRRLRRSASHRFAHAQRRRSGTRPLQALPAGARAVRSRTSDMVMDHAMSKTIFVQSRLGVAASEAATRPFKVSISNKGTTRTTGTKDPPQGLVFSRGFVRGILLVKPKGRLSNTKCLVHEHSGWFRLRHEPSPQESKMLLGFAFKNPMLVTTMWGVDHRSTQRRKPTSLLALGAQRPGWLFGSNRKNPTVRLNLTRLRDNHPA